MTNKTPKNGFHIEYFDSNTLSPGKKREETNYKDGKLDGKWTEWHENGQIKVEANYINGKQEGKLTRWWENGQLVYESNYKDGKEDGKWTSWYVNDGSGCVKDGQIMGEGDVKDGKADGKNTQWYENGHKWSEGNYKDGKEDGKWTTWHDNGQIKVEEYYINGKLVSETEYDNIPLNPKEVKELVGLIDQKIASDAVAKQFVLEELEAATMGNDFAKNFVLTSGFKSEDYKGAMSKSWAEVDGDSGPQKALLGFVFAIANDYGMDAAVELRVTLVDGIMQLYNIGKYAQEGNKK